MKKRIVALLLCIITLLSLVSCGDDLPEGANLPEGMQYAGGEAHGFYLYVPEEWTLSSMDNVVGAFVSNLDISSVSLAQVEKAKDMSIDAYFKSTMEDMPFEDYKLEKDGIDYLLGSVNAKGYEFTYTYKPYGAKDGETNKYRVMQLFGEYQGRLYVFTYTALDEKKSTTSEKTYFQTHIENVNKIIESVQFVTPKSTADTKTDYKKDGDGYLQVAQKRTSGFNLYMHPDWRCTMSSGIVEIVAPSGKANINITEAKDTGVVVSEYWAKRKSDLERYTEGTITVLKENEAVTFGNADQALAYEYTYTYRGETYHIYQVILVHEKIPVFLHKGYVFTFTATEESFATHFEAVKKMMAKVEF